VKKVLIALAVFGLAATMASANMIRVYNVSGRTQAYYGTPRADLAATAYVVCDATANDQDAVIYWTDSAGKKWFQDDWFWNGEVYSGNYDQYGEVNYFTQFGSANSPYPKTEIELYQELVSPAAPTTVNQVGYDRYDYWYLVGANTGAASLPVSMTGVIEIYISQLYCSAVGTWTYDFWLNTGLGTCQATLNSKYSTDAASADQNGIITKIILDLTNAGYKPYGS
jgi:hypothetical protein